MTRSNDFLPLIPEGRYDFVLIDYSTRLMQGKIPKLYLRFGIFELGEFFETELTKYYGIQRVIGKVGKDGGFKVGPMSSFLREYMTLFPDQQIARLDRIPMSRFNNQIIRGEVKTVTKGLDQRKIPKPLQYSAISRLLKAKNV